MDALFVLAASAATALATGLGALPFLVVHQPGRAWLGTANGLAAGCMVGAAVALIADGRGHGAWPVVAGVAAGVCLVAASSRLLGRRRESRLGSLRGADAVKALLVVGVMTLHSAAEGIGVGVAFGGDVSLGIVVTLAIALHNVPEGLAISLVLVPRGASVRAAAGWSVFSSLPQPLLAVPAFLFVETWSAALPAGLGFAAGAMLWLALADLLPEAVRTTRPVVVAAVALGAAGGMLAFQLLVL
jgi:zinc transporter ZupT